VAASTVTTPDRGTLDRVFGEADLEGEPKGKNQ